MWSGGSGGRKEDEFTLNNLSVYITAHKRNISSIVLIADYLGSLFNFFYLVLNVFCRPGCSRWDSESSASSDFPTWALLASCRLQRHSHCTVLEHLTQIFTSQTDSSHCRQYGSHSSISTSNAEKRERRRFLCETRYGNYTNENILEMFTFCVSLFWQSCAAFFFRLFRVWCLSYRAHLEKWFASTTSNLRCWDFFLPKVALFFSSWR